MGIGDFLKDYKPEKAKDSYGILKGTFKCKFNFVRKEAYTGKNADLMGVDFLAYELEVCEGETAAGRRMWKRYNLTTDTAVQKMANMFFTVLNMDIKSDDDLQKACEELVETTVDVRAWGFKPDDADEARQVHVLKGQSKEKGSLKESTTPF